MRLDHNARELVCKVVYCGPGMSGKTTNLHFIHQQAPEKSVGDMVSIDTESERTLHFDLLPLDLGQVQGYQCRFEFYTVPGQSYYAATRRLVLEGADGIVFVVDSRREAMDENIESMNDLNDNLRHHDLPDDIPIVIQYNKQDLPDALKPEQLNPLLNHQGHNYFSASATQGTGVLETMKKITTMVINDVQQHESLGQLPSSRIHRPLEEVVPHAKPPPAAEAAPVPETWLLTCYNCDSMLEVPHAKPGDLYQCGSCQAGMEVVDPDTGQTRRPASVLMPSPVSRHTPPANAAAAPPPPPPPVPGSGPLPNSGTGPLTPSAGSGPLTPSAGTGRLPKDPNSLPQLKDDSSYSLQSLADASRTALGTLPNQDLSPASGNQMLADQFPLPGFTTIAVLDASLLGSRFRVREDANGNVYRALLLSPNVLRQPGYQDALEPHLQMAAGVDHPGLVRLSGLRRNQQHIAVLSVDAPDYQPLNLILSRRKKLQPPQALGIVRQLTEILETASRSGVVHGWIRPEVVLVSGEGKVLLDDIGVPKMPRFLVQESLGASAATEHYLAPEYLQPDTPMDVRTDMFLLGALLFHMIGGQGLVTGYSAHEGLHKVTATGCRSLRDVNPDISRELARLVSRLTEIDRKDRFDNYREMLNMLKRFGGRGGATMRLTKGIPANKQAQERARNKGGRGRTTAGGSGGRSVAGGNAARSATRPDRTPARGNPRARNTTGGGTQRHARGGAAQDDGQHRHRHPPKKKSRAGLVVLLLILLGAAAAGGWYFYDQQQQQRRASQNRIGNQDPGQTDPKQQQTNQDQPPQQEPDRQDPPQQEPDEQDPPTQDPPKQDPVAGQDPPTDIDTDTQDDPVQTAREAIAAFEANPQDGNLQQQAKAAVVALRAEHKSEFSTLWARYTNAVPATGGSTTPPAVTRLQDLLAAQQFQQAYDSLPQLGSSDLQRQWRATIEDQQKAARNELHQQVWAATTIDEAKTIIKPAYETWATSEDRAWADSLLKALAQKFEDQDKEQSSGEAEQVPIDKETTDTGLSPNGFDVDAVRADIALNDALAVSDQRRVKEILQGLKGDSLEHTALQHKAQLWERRATILAGAMKDRSMKLRVSPPISPDEPWDVTQAKAAHLVIQRPQGGSMNLIWPDIQRHELGPLFGTAAKDKAAKPVELALACVANLIADERGIASLYMRRARSANYEGSRELETAILLYQEQEFIQLLDRAEEAITNNDASGLEALIAELSKGDRLENPRLAARVTDLQSKLANLSSGKSATGAQLKDELAFDAADDRDAFPERSGNWIINGGTLSNSGDARVARSDCGNARSATTAFTFSGRQGSAAISFRGVRLLMDFVRQTYQVDSNRDRIPNGEFVFQEHTRYVVHMAYDVAAGKMSIEINNTKPIVIDPGVLDSVYAVQVDTGAELHLDSVSIKRQGSSTGTTGNQAADRQKQQDLLRNLGLAPFGGAYKDPTSPGVVLPAMAKGNSGIGMLLKDNLAGASFTVVGQGPKEDPGKLILGLGSVEANRAVGSFLNLDLPPLGGAPMMVSVSWTADKYTVQIQQEGMADFSAEGDRPDDAVHLVIQTDSSAKLATTPDPVYK